MTQTTNTSRDTTYDSLPCICETCAECPYVGADGNCGGDLPMDGDGGDTPPTGPIASEEHADEHDEQPSLTHTLTLTASEHMVIEQLLCAAADNECGDTWWYRRVQDILAKM